MLCTNLDQLRRARREGYAIPAINTQGGSYDIIMAVCKAAEELKSPVILAHYVTTGAYSGHDWVKGEVSTATCTETGVWTYT